MSLFNKTKPEALNQTIYDLLFKTPQIGRKEAAHFCEHDGICIRFTRARATWHALAPCALKPWWLFLKPLRKKSHNNKANKKNKITTNAVHATDKIEVIDNA